MDLLLLSILITILCPLTVGLVSFLLDHRKADYFLVINLLIILSSYFITTALYFNRKVLFLHYILVEESSFGEFFGIIVDSLSILVGLVVITCGFIFLVYAIDYMSPYNKIHPVHGGKGRFYGWMLLFMGSTIGFIHSSTLIQMTIFFELMSLSCWGLVSFYGSKTALRAANKALLYTHIGAMLGLYTANAKMFQYLHDFSLLSLYSLPNDLKLEIFLPVLIAALSKSAQFPFYSWLPDAMVAPTPASAFLHGAAMIEMGVYLLARIVQFSNIVSYEALLILTIILGLTGFICMIMYPIQRDAKRLLAYSTISESMIMYIALSFSLLGASEGLRASMFQLASHAYIKGLGFLTAGVFGYLYGEHSIGRVKGLINSSKIITIAWISALFGLTGIPPLAIFFSKLYIISVASEVLSPIPFILVLIMLMNSTIFFITVLKWIEETVFKGSASSLEMKLSLPKLMKYSIITLIILSVISPIFTYPLVERIGFYEGRTLWAK